MIKALRNTFTGTREKTGYSAVTFPLSFFTEWFSQKSISGIKSKQLCNRLTHKTGSVRKVIEARSYNHYCSGKAIIITYSECVFVALGIQHATRMRHIVICDLSGCTVFFHFISQTARLSGKKSYWTQNVCFLLSETYLVLRRIERDIVKNVCVCVCVCVYIYIYIYI
jgi:hypothetical protein